MTGYIKVITAQTTETSIWLAFYFIHFSFLLNPFGIRNYVDKMANFNERLSLQWIYFKDNVRENAPFGEGENTSVVAKDQKSRCSEKGRKVCRNPDQLCLTVPPPGRAIKSEEANMQTQLHKYKNTNAQIQVYPNTNKKVSFFRNMDQLCLTVPPPGPVP